MLVLRFHTEIELGESLDLGFTMDVTILDVLDHREPKHVGHVTVGVVPSDGSIVGDFDGLTNLSVRANALYIERLDLEPEWRDRGLEDEVVRRLVETIGRACAFATVEVATPDDVSEWARRGFRTPQDAPRCGPTYACLDLGIRN